MHESRAGTQVAVFGVLLVLTTATLALSFVPLGVYQAPVALGIATLKGLLIALFFMHLLEQPGVNALVLITGLLLLVAFVTLTAADVATRREGPEPLQNGRVEAPVGLNRH